MVGAQFTNGNQQMETFEHRVAEGCKQLCGTVHTMGRAQGDFKQAMFALATKCQGMAEANNANNGVV
jgi:hypothetical protein